MGTSTSQRGSSFWPITVLALLAIAGLSFWASRSPLFHLRELEVTGTAHLTREDVVRLGSLGDGTNVLWLSTRAVEEALEADPWVADASVTRELPGTVRVAIVERVPAASVRGGPQEWFVLASDGMVLESAAEDPGLPPIGLAKGEVPSLEVGAVSKALVRPARAVHAMSPWLAARVTLVRVKADGSMVVRTRLGTVARYGQPEELGTKATALQAILRWSKRESTALASVDLRSPRSPSAVTVAQLEASKAGPKGGSGGDPEAPGADTAGTDTSTG